MHLEEVVAGVTPFRSATPPVEGRAGSGPHDDAAGGQPTPEGRRMAMDERTATGMCPVEPGPVMENDL
jgi:hypothetical protein